MLKKILNSVIKAAIKIGHKQLSKVKNVVIRRLAMFFIEAGQTIALIYLDDDKENEKQLKSAVRALTQRALDEGIELAKEKLLVLKDASLRDALLVYLTGVQKIAGVLVDEDPNNEAQVKAVFESIKKELISVSVDLATDKLAYLIGTKVKDPVLQEVINDFLEMIDDILDKE